MKGIMHPVHKSSQTQHLHLKKLLTLNTECHSLSFGSLNVINSLDRIPKWINISPYHPRYSSRSPHDSSPSPPPTLYPDPAGGLVGLSFSSQDPTRSCLITDAPAPPSRCRSVSEASFSAPLNPPPPLLLRCRTAIPPALSMLEFFSERFLSRNPHSTSTMPMRRKRPSVTAAPMTPPTTGDSFFSLLATGVVVVLLLVSSAMASQKRLML